MLKLIIFLIFILFNSKSFANNEIIFMSLKSKEVNLRAGPNKDFKILYTYKLKGMPVKIIDEYDKWFKIMDMNGDIGWVSEHLLGKTRTIIVLHDTVLFSNYNKEAYSIYRIERNVVCRFIKCKYDKCKIKVGKIKGWINKNDIWGYK